MSKHNNEGASVFEFHFSLEADINPTISEF